MSAYESMLRCKVCGKPVLLLNEAQRGAVQADPAGFEFTCLACLGGQDPFWDDGDG